MNAVTDMSDLSLTRMFPGRAWPCFLDHFSNLFDKRERWRVMEPLAKMLLLLTSATIASCDDFDVAWGEHDLLRTLVNRVDPLTYADRVTFDTRLYISLAPLNSLAPLDIERLANGSALRRSGALTYVP